MKLERKKALVARTLGIGKSRIVFNIQNLEAIKEAITKQDIKDLVADNTIIIKEVKGRKANVKRKTRRRAGSIKKKVKNSKQGYMVMTRKLRSQVKHLRDREQISPEQFSDLRKEIRARQFRSLAHMKERIKEDLA